MCIADVQFVAITNEVLADAGKHFVTTWMRAKVDDLHANIGDATEIAEIGWFAPDALPSPLHLYFQNLLEGHCLPRSPSNMPFAVALNSR